MVYAVKRDLEFIGSKEDCMQKIKRHIYLGKYDRQTLTNMRAHRGVTLPIRENNRQIETGWIINVESENLNAQILPVLPYVKGRGNSAKLSPLPSADQKDYMQRKKL